MDSEPSDGGSIVSDPADGWNGELEPIKVVKRDDVNVRCLFWTEPSPERAHGAKCCGSVRSENCCRAYPSVQNPVHGRLRTLGKEVAGVKQSLIQADAVRLTATQIRGSSFGSGRKPLRPANECHVMMSPGLEPFQDTGNASGIVCGNKRCVDALHFSVEQNNRKTGGQEGIQLRGAASLRGQEKPVDALSGKNSKILVGLGGIFIGISEKHGVSVLPCFLLRGVRKLRKERVADVGHKKADDIGLRSTQ